MVSDTTRQRSSSTALMLMTIVEVMQPMPADLLAAVQRDLQPTEISMIRIDGIADFRNHDTRAH